MTRKRVPTDRQTGTTPRFALANRALAESATSLPERDVALAASDGRIRAPRLATNSASMRDIRLALIAGDPGEGARVVGMLQKDTGISCTCFDVGAHATQLRYAGTFDIAALLLGQRSLTPLAAAVEWKAPLGDPEFLVLAPDARDPASQALAKLGLQRTLLLTHAAAWLREAAPLLALIARSRRQANEAARALPPVPALDDTAVRPQLSLYNAETRFREAYLRGLLLHHPNKRQAAENACIPYRSFRHMIAQLRDA